MRVEYVDYGLANRFDDHIEVNKHLQKEPELLAPILLHEIEHTDEDFSLKDFSMDVGFNKVSPFKLFKFMLRHPGSFTQFLPFYYSKSKKSFIYDINLIIIYLILFLCIYISFTVASAI